MPLSEVCEQRCADADDIGECIEDCISWYYENGTWIQPTQGEY